MHILRSPSGILLNCWPELKRLFPRRGGSTVRCVHDMLACLLANGYRTRHAGGIRRVTVYNSINHEESAEP